MEKAEQTLLSIKNAIDKSYDQIESGQLMESDVLESVYALVDGYFKNK